MGFPPATTSCGDIVGNQHRSVSLPSELTAGADYEIVLELGRGGMGVVYLAKNRLMGREEVLKVMGPGITGRPGAAERFRREIQSAARLDHRNIVRAYSARQYGEQLVLAMEFVPGDDLGALVKARGPLPVVNACYYAQQVALGLQHAHEHVMVHRDIKPANLILHRAGKRHTVKILDFGLAKVTSETREHADLTGSGQMMGTPLYMAPEQARDAAAADIRADIYSLGCTLYYLLAAVPPLSGGVLAVLSGERPRPLDEARPEVSPELAAVVARMMAKAPADRFQTPAEVAAALDPFLRARPAQALVPTAVPGSTKADAPPSAPGRLDAWGELTLSEPTSAPTTSVASPLPAGAARRVQRWVLPAAVGVAVLVLVGVLTAPGVVRVKTTDGVIVLENAPAGAEVTVDGETATLEWPGGKSAEVRARAGERKLEVRMGKDTILSTNVTLRPDGREPVEVRWESPAGPKNPLTHRAAGVGLLRNPGAEEPSENGPMPGWRVVSGQWWRRHTTIAPRRGEAYFHPGKSAVAELAQDVDVSGYAADIDAGRQAFVFAGHVRCSKQDIPDTARVVVEYRDTPGGAILAQFDTQPIRHHASWKEVSDRRVAPPRTRLIRIRLMSIRSHAATSDACYDDLSLKAVPVAAR